MTSVPVVRHSSQRTPSSLRGLESSQYPSSSASICVSQRRFQCGLVWLNDFEWSGGEAVTLGQAAGRFEFNFLGAEGEENVRQ